MDHCARSDEPRITRLVLLPLGLALLLSIGCLSSATRSVRQQFASDYACPGTNVTSRGRGHYVAQGCGRAVEYTCRTRSHSQFGLFRHSPSRVEETFCTAHEVASPAPQATAARTPDVHAEHVVDRGRGVTYFHLLLAKSWWQVRFLAPEADGAVTGEVVIALRSASRGAALTGCTELVVTTGDDEARFRLPPREAPNELVAQFRTTLPTLRAIAMSDRARFEGCNVTHTLDALEHSELRRLVLMTSQVVSERDVAESAP